MTFSDPAQVINRLASIENDMASRQAAYESAARNWYVAKRDKEKARAIEFVSAEGSVAQRSAVADIKTSVEGKNAEAEYEALKAVMRTLEARASIGQSILRAQARI